MSCPNCGMLNNMEAPFCRSCGCQLPGIGSRSISATVRERLLRSYEVTPRQPLLTPSEPVEANPWTWAMNAAKRKKAA